MRILSKRLLVLERVVEAAQSKDGMDFRAKAGRDYNLVFDIVEYVVREPENVEPSLEERITAIYKQFEGMDVSDLKEFDKAMLSAVSEDEISKIQSWLIEKGFRPQNYRFFIGRGS